jgi:phage host-nuclease inhibitor protein Gam
MSEQEVKELFMEPIAEFAPEELMTFSKDSMDVTKKLYAIRALKREVNKFKDQSDKSFEFYSNRIERINKQIEFLEKNVEEYLLRENLKNIVTPAGTAMIVNREKWEWKNPSEILEWCRVHAPELIKIVQEEKVDKAELKKKIKENQEVPIEIVQVHKQADLEIRDFSE